MRHIPAVLLLVFALSACEDNFTIEPILATDTVEVYAPIPQNEGLPTALDVMSVQFWIQGARYPERAAHAEQWDFAVRIRDGEMTLVPAAMLGLNSRAAIAGPFIGQTFEGFREAPGSGAFSTDEAAVMREGQVFAARSRQLSQGFQACPQYSKLQPLEVDVEAGRLRLVITTNERCGDLRLVMGD